MGRAMLIAITMIGCRPPPAPAVSNTATSHAIEGPWLLAAGDLVDVIDDRVITWDRTWDAGRGGLAEASALDGTHLRTRTIAGLTINGGLRMWRPVAGGYLAFWDGPAFVAEHGDALALGWRAPGDDWFDAQVIVDGSVIVAGARARAGVVRLALGDGHEQWRAPLAAGAQDVALSSDGAVVYASWREPDPGATGGASARRVRALELATGRTSWTHDFTAEPGALAVAHGMIVAAIGGDLHVIDGATGQVRAQVPLGAANVYPAVRIDRDRVFVALGDRVTALALATGATLWRAPVALDGGPRLTVAGSDLVVSTASGTVLALARDSGERRWEIGIGLAPAALVATSAALVAHGHGRVVGFKLPPAIRSEAARLHGRVIGNACGPIDGAIVRVGGTQVAVDSTGHYHAEIVARGIVTVSVTAARLMSSSGAPSVATIRLDGRGRYEVPDLAPSQCDASG
jgi:outer membrane protein assembly factor BamB